MAFDFERLSVYNKAVEFAEKIYGETRTFPKEEMFGLCGQLRRAAVSISANIAEGSGRQHKKDFSQFLRMARASACECIPLLEISVRQDYISQETHRKFIADCNEIGKMLNGLIRSLNS